MSRKWISQRLRMGDVSWVTQAISTANMDKDLVLLTLKKRLAQFS